VTKVLTDIQRRQYFDDGLLFPVSVLSAEEAGRFRTASDALETGLGGKPRTVEVRQMHLHFPWAYELALQPRALDAVEDLLGPDILVWATELFTKHPRDGSVSIGWHRDRSYMSFEGGETVSAWIALADSIPANGCMRAVPGSGHRQAAPAQAARVPEAPTPRRRSTAVEVDEGEAVDVILRAGQMSLHDIDVVHGSGPNHSDQKRIGFVVRYITPEARPREGRPPAVLARGRDPYGHYEPVGRPTETDAAQALRGMRQSAARHLEAMLHNLKNLQS
jgi:non-haem Fe2+, alpha-ketoglutarate-dependent halogenase